MPNGSLSPATSSPGRRIRLGREFLFHGILFLKRESFCTVLRDFFNIFFFSYDVFMVFVTCIPVDLGEASNLSPNGIYSVFVNEYTRLYRSFVQILFLVNFPFQLRLLVSPDRRNA